MQDVAACSEVYGLTIVVHGIVLVIIVHALVFIVIWSLQVRGSVM